MRENRDAPSQKHSTKRVKGSLALRVFFVVFLLLVIPLFVQDLLLYRSEYEAHLSEAKEVLDVIGKEREAAIEQRIKMEWEILDNASRDIEKYKKEFHIQRIPFPAGAADRFGISDPRRKALLIGIRESPTSALAIPIPFTALIADLDTGKTPYPIRMALIDPDGTVLAESKPAGESEDLLVVHEEVPSADLDLLITVPIDSIRDLEKKTYFFRLGALLFFVGVLGGGAVWLLTRRISRPLNHLAKTMARVSEGAVHARYTRDWMGFEINALGMRFNETLDAVLNLTERAEKERIAREKLAEEWRIGHDIQEGLFPKQLPGAKNLEIASAYLPAKEVNGDFYDLFVLDDGNLLIAIADTAGKGISACLFSLGLRGSLRSLATVTRDLSEIVQRANDLFWIDARNSSMFASLWIGLYNPETATLTYCSQGHPPALLLRSGQLEELWTGGIAMGAQKFDAVPTKQITLLPGDWLLLYTDGIIEAHDPEGNLFGKDRLRQSLLSAKKRELPQHWVDHLLKEISSFSLIAPQHDDITLLLLHIKNLSQ
jgi:serine phosphatase RsbU (regulator of sigma subunit)